ncbi:DinB family protein [Flavobacterium salilacus subsp. salilacus]|uniref:DinB family protein n=1 Tax=Flavobacterium TaxID=237 RepID=UPI001074F04D|nr:MULTISPECIES: DinB family protein [Flavobacterium]KAF2516291.1 DinB family protein [Flavobacterium salilacus subsp. salilacus]MBE1613821.1 DinB family protein [Flavobacterium sp. SaA2.13]
MNLLHLLLQEMDKEAAVTRKFLERVSAEKFDWQPHPKSMTMKVLAAHIAELPGWVTMAITTDGLDFANNPYQPKDVKSTEELLSFFEENLKSAKETLAVFDSNEFTKEWVLSNSDQILNRDSKYGVIRMTYSQIVHHRAQLGVYFRLLDIPVPASYGPSADDMGF